MSSKKPAKPACAPVARPSPRAPGEKPARVHKSAVSNAPRGHPAPGADFQASPSGSGGHHEVTPVPTFAPKGLTPIQWRFAQEYVGDADLNATEAYIRANPKVTRESARVEASRLLANPNIAREIRALMDERAMRTGITADRVLVRLWAIATADARKLTEYRIGSCRHCYGMGYEYQYTDAEFSAAQDKHIREETKRRKAEGADYKARDFPEKGGSGFDPAKPPNPECPECWGDGKGRPIIHDTRHLGEGEAALFSGIKVTRTQHGETVNVHMEDRANYLQMVGRHLGMWNDKLKVVDETNPLHALIQEIQKAHSTLPIVAKDPEARQHVTDVEAKFRHTHSAPGADSPVRKAQKPNNWRPVK